MSKLNEQLFASLEQDVKRVLSQATQLNEKIILPLLETLPTLNDTINAIIFDQLEDERSVTFENCGSYKNSFQKYSEDVLKPMNEKYKQVSPLFDSAFICKSNLTRGCFSCVAKSFVIIVNETWDEWVKELDEICNEFEVPMALFDSVRDLMDYFRDNVNRIKLIEFVNNLKRISEHIETMNERLSKNMEILMGRVRAMKDSKDKDSTEVKKLYRSLYKAEFEFIEQYNSMFDRFEELMAVGLVLYAKFVTFYEQVSHVKKFNKIWNTLDALLSDSEIRIEKMLIIPTILKLVYARDEEFINTVMPDVHRMVAELKKLKQAWRKIYTVKRIDTMENLEEALDLLQALKSNWKSHKSLLAEMKEDMKQLQKVLKSNSLSAITDSVTKSQRKLSEKLSKIGNSEDREKKKEEKKRKKEEQKRQKEEERRLKEERKKLKKQERMRDTEGVSSGKVILRGVENIGKDIQQIDVAKPFNFIKSNLEHAGAEIKEKAPRMINPKDMFKGHLFGFLRGNAGFQ